MWAVAHETDFDFEKLSCSNLACGFVSKRKSDIIVGFSTLVIVKL